MSPTGPEEHATKGRSAPGVVAPTNRITVAFPFSQIKTADPGPELGELAGVVAELAALVEGLSPSPEATALRERAEALVARLR